MPPCTPKIKKTAAQRKKINFAVTSALKRRNLSHFQVAQLLGVEESTVSNAISQADFSDKKAKIWSDALQIPIEVFTIGESPLPPNDYESIMTDIEDLRSDIRQLQSQIDDLVRRTGDLESR